MKIGYPCINRTVGCKGDRTFRLKSYSEERLIDTVENNLICLLKMLEFNVRHNILFFRITSDLVPFASHPVCKFDWQSRFERRFREIGDFIKDHDIRISMHPDQFILINSLDPGVLQRSLKELSYHVEVLDLMELDSSAKIQFHVGGVYGDRKDSIRRFIERFGNLSGKLRSRLVIENDDRLYRLRDCLQISRKTGAPVVFDFFHHEANNRGETIKQSFELFTGTWKGRDGVPLVDYSSQQKDAPRRRHAETIDLAHFRDFLEETKPFDYDVMLEVKDKEKSAQKAVQIASEDPRFHTSNESDL